MLNKCPFCNSPEVEILENDDCCWVHCMKCNADGPIKSNTDDAISYWNKAGVTNGKDAA